MPFVPCGGNPLEMDDGEDKSQEGAVDLAALHELETKHKSLFKQRD
jgi:hypothetical protein